jgi:hypothetical protein
VRPRTRPHPSQRQSQGPIREEQAQRPTPQDPTTCQAPPPAGPRSTPRRAVLADTTRCRRQLIDVPPLSNPLDAFGRGGPPGHHQSRTCQAGPGGASAP